MAAEEKIWQVCTGKNCKNGKVFDEKGLTTCPVCGGKGGKYMFVKSAKKDDKS